MALSDQEIDLWLLNLLRAPADADSGLMSKENWQRVVAQAREHRFLPYLDWTLRTRNGITLDAVTNAERRGWAVRALTIRRECERIHQILAGAGIEHLFLKGVAFAFNDYPEPWLRTMRDIDLIVPKAALMPAHELLIGAGAPIDKFKFRPLEIPEDQKHLPPFLAPNRTISVELHDKVAIADPRLNAAGLALLHDQLWRDTRRVSGLPVPSAEVMLIHAIIHGFHGHELNNGPMIVADLRYLIEKHSFDTGWLADLVDGLEIGPAMALAAALVPNESRTIFSPWLSGHNPAVMPSDATFAALLFQPNAQRSELRLHTTLKALPLHRKLAMLMSRFFGGRAAIRSRWMIVKGSADGMPRNGAGLWGWYLAHRFRQAIGRLKGQATGTGPTSNVEHLARLRRALAATHTDSGRR